MKTSELFHSGMVTLIGRTNVGKSTLINCLVGDKVSIISDKPQTTRNRIHCILTRQNGQAIFLDTPGLHTPKSRLGERMNQYALESLREVDLILFITTAEFLKPGKGDLRIIQQLKPIPVTKFLVINKSDLVSREALAECSERFFNLADWGRVFFTSALNCSGLEALSDSIFETLPEGPLYYPADMMIDQPERFLISEIIREKVLQLTRQEVPHGVAVIVEGMQDITREGSLLNYTRIEATIYVERESPKGIIIGSGGSMLKAIGSQARSDLEKLLGQQVHLDLRVKVRKDWRDSEFSLREFGYRRNL
ncbi:MAG: GTPase Era [Symbiobacteriaceae bacterium]|nr:GTPase Era [Symbiobacteriaceae bacterium]